MVFHARRRNFIGQAFDGNIGLIRRLVRHGEQRREFVFGARLGGFAWLLCLGGALRSRPILANGHAFLKFCKLAREIDPNRENREERQEGQSYAPFRLRI